jgi:long-chain acyl-CoA synthetase
VSSDPNHTNSEEVWWVFDVDATLVDSFTGSSLRPGAFDLLVELTDARQRVFLWSAGGADYAQRRAQLHQVDSMIEGFYSKEERSDGGRFRTDHFVPPEQTAIYIDDIEGDPPEEMIRLHVSPYLVANDHDRGLEPVKIFVREFLNSRK